jgi:hypothetical protein
MANWKKPKNEAARRLTDLGMESVHMEAEMETARASIERAKPMRKLVSRIEST